MSEDIKHGQHEDPTTVPSIESVLSYWFDGSWSENYKTKWFATGETQATTDAYIHSHFDAFLRYAHGDMLDSWLEYGPLGYLALIIVLDQFSRHIFRFKEIPADSDERKLCDSKALAIAEKLVQRPEWFKSFTVAQHVFSLMPFRHSATLDRLRYVLESIDVRERHELEALELVSKFRNQTLRRLQHLEDRSKAEESSEILERFPFDADESKIYDEPLVLAVERFLSTNMRDFKSLKYQKADSPTSIAISLSGGVDSMVISKILNLLQKKHHFSRVAAIHIDYANRTESGREADYVEWWSNKMGCEFHKRTINEVTRGITDRSEYERIARDIRYGFYKEVLSSINSPGVIFGHHMGDVQENIISNIMRGCSPLQLSGMSEVGIANGVNVWRPLLAYPKSDIYDFAHKYGVPYFKDTTPSWSTRGKLRNKLVPLLTDMYGEGFLRNLSHLGKESDDFNSLVHDSIFHPFTSSVRRHVCGLSVKVLPYRSKPLCFWKEMLKELMHSMGMSMVRDKAVTNFMERLQRGNKEMSGWLELRKGFHTHLSVDGDLTVYRHGVLSDHASVSRGIAPLKTTAPSELDTGASNTSNPSNWKSDVTFNLDSIITDFRSSNSIVEYPEKPSVNIVTTVGVWDIAISFIYGNPQMMCPTKPQFLREFNHSEISLSKPPFQNIADLLPGRFSYNISIPYNFQGRCSLVVYDDYSHIYKQMKENVRMITSESVIYLVPTALSKVDNRLKQGLPLLVAKVEFEKDTNPAALSTIYDSSGLIVINLEYNYRG